MQASTSRKDRAPCPTADNAQLQLKIQSRMTISNRRKGKEQVRHVSIGITAQHAASQQPLTTAQPSPLKSAMRGVWNRRLQTPE